MKVRKPRSVRESPSTRQMEDEDTRSSEVTSRVEQEPGSRMPGQREDVFKERTSMTPSRGASH